MRHPSMFPAVAGVIAALAAGAVPAQAQDREPASAEEVIARYVAALGGEAHLAALKQRHAVTRLELGTGEDAMRAETELRYLAPDRVRVRAHSPITGESDLGYDGEVAWMSMPATGPRRLAPSDMHIVWALIPTAPRWPPARRLTFLGRRDFEGAPMHVITWADSLGSTVTEYFDVRTGLRRAMEYRDPASGKRITTLSSDYATRDGYTLPFRQVTRIDGDTVSTAVVTALDHGPIPVSTFAPPPELRKGEP